MNKRKLESKKGKIKKAIELFRKMGQKNKGWDGVKEIIKWRDILK